MPLSAAQPERRAPLLPSERQETTLAPRQILYWIYAGRLAVALGVYGAAVVVGNIWTSGPAVEVDPGVRLLAILALCLAGLVTPVSYWYSHRRDGPLGLWFLYGQALLDIFLVTGVVHITGGPASVFPPLLYIALVSGYALLLPLGAGVLVALATGLAYLADVALAYPERLDAAVWLQVGVFTVVATVSGLIGGRLRQVGHELSTVESELRRLRLGTADILGTLESGVLTLDGSGRTVYMNRAAEELLGLETAAWLGRSVLDELDVVAPGVSRAVRQTLARRRPIRSREVEIHPDEEAMPAAVHTGLLERSGMPDLVTVVLQDMRLARQLEELHLRAGRLEAVAELSSSLAHEIRNPLASIRSAVEQLVAAVPEDEDSGTLGRLIVRETDRLSRLLGEFNDFARVDVVERRPLEVRVLIEEVVELIRQRPDAERATFRVDVRGPLDDLWGDPDLVHRVLLNLVLNAVQVGGRAGHVTVRVVADALEPEAVPQDMAQGRPVRIRVVDDGPGIEPEELGKVFDPFYTRREGGSGMGLAIAHRAVTAHGGALLVSSEPGRGATFTVILPRRDAEEREEMARQGWPEEAAAADSNA